ncbi:ferric reductase-like transmembrane domain-containing protein [Cryobacterium sp. PH29-G1]|uniref:ferric reductase-like transmembrane domain-containing protein n=1 Tax=Cryobacterium sp. PH29-G1 TaxID=3046211 RepID=UPI0024BB4FD3|nr:ferric reductase-like transmembrane domain-containing protein [Cryobacterium sp. PH29-G1]MDJ0349365.1 ferric reductase-like transmembrane domain-containing protein [Cryobacterium sp. PH29-G1]
MPRQRPWPPTGPRRGWQPSWGRPLLTLPRFAVALVHRNVALLATAFILVHMVSLLGGSHAQLTVVEFFVPFLGAYKPLWLGLGTVAVDLLIAIIATSLLRRFVGLRVFRVVHWLTYLLWPIALAHAIGNGTDATTPWFIAFAVLSTIIVFAAVAWRVTAGFVENSASRTPQHRPAPAQRIGRIS